MDDKTELSRGKPNLSNEPDGRTVADVTPAGTDQRTIALPGETVPAAPEPEALRAVEDAVAAEWSEGDILLNLYEVRGVLGEGGMGKVYRIRHRAWNLDLAVKSPRPETIAQAGGQENFVREAETWVDLGLHPHTVSCYYVRTLGGIPRVFAELVEGGSLADWIRTRKLYEGGAEKALERILDIAIQFAWGLQHAHEHGLIHQDVKPANVMMTPDGTAKVTDFGLAKARGLARQQSEVIAGGSVLVSAGGMTPAYCSPEQAARQPLSRKTDIWSWGVSVLEMFTGEVTWLAGQAAAQALQSYLEAGTGEAALPRMPEAIEGLLMQCFAPDPQARPKDMNQVVEDLRQIYQASAGTAYARPEPRAADLLADGLNNRGVSLLDLGRKEEAEKAFDQALSADAHHLEATYNRGLLLWRSVRMTDDILVKQLEEVRTTHTGEWRDEYLLGLVHMERGDGESAVKLLEQALHQAPQEKEIRQALEVARSSQGEWHSWVPIFFEGRTDELCSLSISPDGHWVLSGTINNQLLLWELATGKRVRTFEGHTSVVNCVSISPDGRWALSGGDSNNALRLWDLATGQCLRTFEGHKDWVRSVSISPDGRWALSGSHDKTLRLWELATGECVRTFEGHTDHVESVSVSPDGRWGLSGSHDTTLRLWELSTGNCVRTFEGHTDRVYWVSISPDGRWALSGGWDKSVRLWELATGNCVRVFTGHTISVHSGNVSQDGRWALSGCWDRTLRLWDLATGRCIRTFEGHTNPVNFRMSPDGHWGLSFSEEKLGLLKLRSSGPIASVAVAYPRSSAEVVQAEIAIRRALERAKSALSQGDASRAAVEVSDARRIPGYERHDELLELCRQIGLRGKSKRFTGGWLRHTLKGHAGSVLSVTISPDGHWGLSGSSDTTLRLWELSTGNCVRTFEGHEGQVTSVSISPDGRWGLSGGGYDKTLRLWDLATGQCARVFKGHTFSVNAVSISPDGRWGLSGSDDNVLAFQHKQSFYDTLQLWELATGRCVRIFGESKNKVKSVSISPDGHWGLSGSGGAPENSILWLWELATGRCVRRFDGHMKEVNSVVISPDGRWAMSGSSDKTVRLWDLATGQCLRTFEGHTDYVYCVSISPDGRWALSGSDDNTLRLWELATGKCVRTFQGHTEGILCAAISPDGRWALSGSRDKTLRLWELEREFEFPPHADWDEGAQPYLESFLVLHTPYAAELPQDHAPSEGEVRLALTRRSKPSWNELEFDSLIRRLQCAGCGWLRPEGVRQKLEEMAATRTSSQSGRSDGVPTPLSARVETAKDKKPSEKDDALATALKALEQLAGQPNAQQALLAKILVEQLQGKRQPGVAQQPRAGGIGKAKPQPAPIPMLQPRGKAAVHPTTVRKNKGLARRLLNAGLVFKVVWFAGWLVLIFDQLAGQFFSSHFLPASEFRIPIDRCWDAGALGVAAILLLMIAPFVIERVAAGRKSPKKGK